MLRIFNGPRDGYVLVTEHERIGRLSEESVTICGFSSKADAVTAASVAFHALRARLAGPDGARLDGVDASGEAAWVSVRRPGSRRRLVLLRAAVPVPAEGIERRPDSIGTRNLNEADR